MERYILKNNAKEQIRGKWGITILTFLVAEAITGGVTTILNIGGLEHLEWLGVIINLVLGGLMEFGIIKFSLNIAKRENFEFTDIFDGFKDMLWLKIIGLYFIITLITMAGFIVLIVPGIIIYLMFSQSFFILCEDETKSIRECLDQSMKMMDGHKTELFVLNLSFIGWILLVAVTCGIAALWVNPYMKVTLTNYYLALKNQDNKVMDDFVK